ncbi:hypothetical protein [Stenomitos frigidus]|uniref:Rho-binding antiterminator n=1 Tax=Stenomitos frigidus ULC18 TaxID=2107698 RepID=A0A2T1EA07_9CYAN|nr:hypothetical protein [Stenomitos frigidus]PSB29533.1 hypothetical protein C7B82_10925 [Stenomitos frigidus ULC18]
MDDYRLVDCGFHDQLEALSTLRQTCQITYRNVVKESVAEELVEVRTQIIDVYAANKADFLKLSDGTEIRLDRLLSVDGKPICFTQA